MSEVTKEDIKDLLSLEKNLKMISEIFEKYGEKLNAISEEVKVINEKLNKLDSALESKTNSLDLKIDKSKKELSDQIKSIEIDSLTKEFKDEMKNFSSSLDKKIKRIENIVKNDDKKEKQKIVSK